MTRLCAFLAATVLASSLFGTYAHAQNASPDVVLLDVAKVFEQHQRFKQGMDQLKTELEAYEQHVTGRRQEIQANAKEAQAYDPGSPEYEKHEETAARAMADLRVEMAKKRKAFQDQEAKLYYTTYLEVQKATAEFANRHGIRMVQRFDSGPINGDDRASILKGVNRNVVFQANLDITGHIIQKLNNPAVSRRPGAGATQ